MECKNVRKRLDAYFDGEVSPDLVSNMETHIEQCDECLGELEERKKLGRILARLETPPVPGGFVQKVLDDVSVKQNRRFGGRLVRRLAAAVVALGLGVGIVAVSMTSFVDTGYFTDSGTDQFINGVNGNYVEDTMSAFQAYPVGSLSDDFFLAENGASIFENDDMNDEGNNGFEDR